MKWILGLMVTWAFSLYLWGAGFVISFAIWIVTTIFSHPASTVAGDWAIRFAAIWVGSAVIAIIGLAGLSITKDK